MSNKDLDRLLEELQNKARPASEFFGLSGDIQDTKYRRFRIHKSYLQRLRRQKERSLKKRRKKRRAEFLRFRYRGYIFVERARYYERLEQSYWWYLKQKYGKGRVLTLEEFDTYVAPHYDSKDPSLRLARIDRTRKDFFLDNIQVLRMHNPDERFVHRAVQSGNYDLIWRYSPSES